MHQQAVYGVVRGIAGNPHDADDATQEAFIRVHRRLSGFRGESSLRTWVTAIAVNAAHDLLRRRRLLGLLPLGRRHEETLAAAGPGPEEGLMARQLGARVAAFVAAAIAPRGPEPDWEAQRRAVMRAVGRPRRLRFAGAALAAGLFLAIGAAYFAAQGPGLRGTPPAATPHAEQGLALFNWRAEEAPEEEEFDRFLEFLVPIPREGDNNETSHGAELGPGGRHAGGAGLA